MIKILIVHYSRASLFISYYYTNLKILYSARKCVAPPNVENSQRSNDGRTYKNKIEYTCQKNFKKAPGNASTSMVICEINEDGILYWEGSENLTNCIPIYCDKPEAIPNANELTGDYGQDLPDTSRQIICLEGYYISRIHATNMIIKCQQESASVALWKVEDSDEYWDEDNFSCEGTVS